MEKFSHISDSIFSGGHMRHINQYRNIQFLMKNNTFSTISSVIFYKYTKDAIQLAIALSQPQIETTN